MSTTPLWSPSSERRSQANLTNFFSFASKRAGITFEDYRSLHNWSVTSPGDFWTAVWDFTGVLASERGRTSFLPGATMREAAWFPDSRLNFAENLLRHNDEHPALISYTERGRRTTLSYAQLRREVERVAGFLTECGVAQGDRVAGFLPNLPEAVVAMLATASIGAIWSSCSPDFGAKGVLDRFGQIEPKVLFCADGYYYNGKAIQLTERIGEIRAHLPSLARLVLINVLEPEDLADTPQDVVRYEQCAANPRGDLRFAQLPFAHPLYIMYSSGTTGTPKCIVHGAGGTLLQHLKELVLHTDLRREDRIFYFTTCGWMMWNWLVSSLAVGATVILYDGSPFYPGPGALMQLAEREAITIFGTSAKYLAALEKSGEVPSETRNLHALRAVLSTGSPLLPESFDYVYRAIKSDVQLASISGGTDIISCFMLGNPLLPVYRGELQCRGLGMAVEIFDAGGSVAPVGTPGELVCTAPFPSMPIYFWNDPGDKKYHASYFARFAGVWHHGDWVEATPHGGYIIYGRSDAVLNPGGVRIGTAEIYSIAEQIAEVVDSLVIGQQWEGDERVVLFVKLRPGTTLDDSLRERIKREIRAQATPRHVPAKIVQVPDIPRTISGKIVELAVKRIVHGRPVDNKDALANPEALEYFRDLPELQK